MKTLRIILGAVLLAIGTTHAQTPASPEEIAFWETVRDSRNAAELQAYIDQYPNGRFVVLAKARLAGLQGQRPAPVPVPPPTQRLDPPQQASLPSKSYSAGVRLPQAGDTWTYRLSYPRLRGQWGQIDKPARTQVVKVESSSDSEIVDQISVDGAAAAGSRHTRGAYTLTQDVSIFSPYLVDFTELARAASLGDVTIQETSCRSTHACVARARVSGTEVVQVPAGTFSTVRVVVEQSWRPGPSATAMGQSVMATMNGGRTLTIWYAPEVKRAVKFSSRPTVGDVPPVETNFDLELVSYQLK
jgi:hypothetical protein